MLNLLLEHERSANINIQDNEDGRTPLQIAITRGNVQAFNTLLEHGADPEIADYHQERALHFAVEQENPEFLTRLLAIDGIDINPINYMGDTPLHTAAEVGNTHTVAILLRQGDVDVNVTTPQVQESEILEGFTPLHRAAENGHWDTAIQLLEAGANPLAQNHYGDTPSVTARGFGHHALADAIERYSVLKFKGSYVVEDQQQQILGDFRPFEERFVEALEQAFARGLTALLLADIQTFLSRKGF